MSLTAFLAFAGLVLFAVVSPGPAVLMSARTGLTEGFRTGVMLAFGIGFEFPIVLVFAQMAGLVTPEQLASGRRWAIVIIFVAVAVLTPSGDPYSQFVLSIPMVLFYEISILIGRALRRRQTATVET